ncbi:MAG: hypothetical protein U0174_08720 [Polyangiaceae bacterium]
MGFRHAANILAPVFLLTLARGEAHAEEVGKEPRPVERKLPRPSLVWGLTQLIPSPTWFVSTRDVHFALGFQVTPVLYSFGTHEDISPWRFFVADPWARHGGSIELFAAPYVFFADPKVASKFGARVYLPIEGRGEQLSFAYGMSAFTSPDGTRLAFDAAFYTASGMVGLEATYLPTLDPYAFAISLRLRAM